MKPEKAEDKKKAQRYKLVHVNMTENTLNKIEEVQDRVHAENKTTAIRYSIDIADMITDVISRGGKVILEENGNKYIMKLPGIVQHGKQ
ncbi:MAG: hypothetical protein EPO11_00940 [Gammaproteobacteria bacterium]|nr:MAG: hypothetical protein EPO11_00940 [Gammaproteobacteria bacterium]